MAFDGIVTKAIVTELNDILGAKVDKIYEPDKNTIIIGLYYSGQHYALNICIDAHNCRINLTTHSKPNPLVAPNFCMLLRKHLIPGKISSISMNGLERIVRIEIETINEFNEIEIKTLVIELMGKHSNIILLNKDNIVIDAMRHANCLNNSYRDIFPSKLYTLPASNKLDFLEIKNFEDFYSKISNNDNDLAKNIANTFTGFSLSFVKSAISICNVTSQSKDELNKLYNYFCEILNKIGSSELSFETIYKNDNIYDYSLVLDKNITNFNLSNYIDNFYFERETLENFTNKRNSILKLILDILNKYNTRLLHINSKLEECADMDKYKLYGELITANLYRLNNNHSNFIELENYYDNNNLIKIPLDIKYSANINAKHYFKKYSKLKNALVIVNKQKEETENELNYLESIVYELDNCTNIEDIQNIFEEISENGIFKDKLKNKKKQNSKKKKTHTSFSPIEYEIDGFKIYVGRNNKENDWLTFKFASKNDIWFHTKDIHGSHVILKASQPINDEILIKCAQIAAKHSKARNSSNIPVDYCNVQFVKKPASTKPGMVIFTNNKTLNVNPF